VAAGRDGRAQRLIGESRGRRPRCTAVARKAPSVNDVMGEFDLAHFNVVHHQRSDAFGGEAPP
jgi:hypothetical protein